MGQFDYLLNDSAAEGVPEQKGLSVSREPLNFDYLYDVIDPPEQPEERSTLGMIGSSVAKGVAGLGEMGLQVARSANPWDESQAGGYEGEEAPGFMTRQLEKLRAYKQESPTLQDRPEDYGAVPQGISSAVTSLGVSGLGGAIGLGAGALLGTAALPAVMTGVGIAALTSYFFSSYDQNMEEQRKAGTKREDAEVGAVLTGLAEAVPEAAMDVFLPFLYTGRIVTAPGKAALKQTLMNMVKKSPKEFAKRVGIGIGAETGTELLTGGLQEQIRGMEGLSEGSFLEGVKQAAGPAFVASLLFAGLGEGTRRLQKKEIINNLQNPDAKPENRLKTVNEVYTLIKEDNAPLAEEWKNYAEQAVQNGEAIDMESELGEAKNLLRPQENIKTDEDKVQAAADKTATAGMSDDILAAAQGLVRPPVTEEAPLPVTEEAAPIIPSQPIIPQVPPDMTGFGRPPYGKAIAPSESPFPARSLAGEKKPKVERPVASQPKEKPPRPVITDAGVQDMEKIEAEENLRAFADKIAGVNKKAKIITPEKKAASDLSEVKESIEYKEAKRVLGEQKAKDIAAEMGRENVLLNDKVESERRIKESERRGFTIPAEERTVLDGKIKAYDEFIAKKEKVKLPRLNRTLPGGLKKKDSWADPDLLRKGLSEIKERELTEQEAQAAEESVIEAVNSQRKEYQKQKKKAAVERMNKIEKAVKSGDTTTAWELIAAEEGKELQKKIDAGLYRATEIKEAYKALEKLRSMEAAQKRLDDVGKAPVVKPVKFSTAKNIPASGTLKEEDVKKIFRGQKVTTNPDGIITVQVKSGPLTIESVDFIDAGNAEFSLSRGRELKPGEKAAGQYQSNKIKITKNLGDQWTLYHEGVHWAEDNGLITNPEITILKNKIKSLVEEGKFTPDNQKDIGGAEDRARFIEQELPKRKEYAESSVIRKILQRIADFGDQILNLFVRTNRGILRDIESGKLFGREGKKGEKTSVPQYERTARRWYSQMEKTLAQKLPNNSNVKMLKNMIGSWEKKGDIKAEELEWSGLMDFLEGKEGKVSKQEILGYLKDNNVRVEEVVKGSFFPELTKAEIKEVNDLHALHVMSDEMTDTQLARYSALVEKDLASVDDTKFSEYQVPGGKNYKELLLTLPGRQVPDRIQEKFPFKIQKIKDGRVDGLQYAETQKEAMERADKIKADPYYDDAKIIKNVSTSEAPKYKSSHFDESNILAHVRFNERLDADGNKVLFIEEIQSDWHQEGKKKGYGPIRLIVEYKGEDGYYRRKIFDTKQREEAEQFANKMGGSFKEDYYDEYGAMAGVPNAPFKGSSKWSLLALKRMTRYATENGFDKIAWTTGEIQADRYDLSKQVERITARKKKDGTYNLKVYPISGRVEDINGLSTEKLEDTIGKELAKKIVSQETGRNINYEGLDLKVGGEGMKGFYDKILPSTANKFFNKKTWGKAKVGSSKIYTASPETKLEIYKNSQTGKYEVENIEGRILHIADTAEDADKWLMDNSKGVYMEVWSMPITPEMKSKALREGMPLFKTTPQFSTVFKSSNPLVEERYQNSNVAMQNDPRTRMEKLKEFFTGNLKGFRRQFIEIDESKKENAKAITWLQRVRDYPLVAREKAVTAIDKITRKLNTEEFKLFERKVILDDQKYELDNKHTLQFGYDAASLEDDIERLNSIIENKPKIQAALAERKRFMDDIKKRLIETGVLTKDQIKNPSYFRHMVLEYALEKQAAQGQGSKVKTPKPGYGKGRSGVSLADINSNYLEAEFEFAHRALTDINTAEVLNNFEKSEYNIIERLRKEASESNDAAAMAIGINPDELSKAELKILLGPQYATWEKLIPEGYEKIQADEGLAFTVGNSLSDKLVADIAETLKSPQFADLAPQVLEDIADGIHKQLMVSGRKPFMVLPEGIAKTIKSIRPPQERTLLNMFFRKPLTAWKQWVLINPRRFFKYNLNNLSGDLDAVIAGNPRVLKKLPRAIKELWRVMYKGSDPSQAYADAVERGVFSSGISMNEIPDINTLSQFSRLQERLSGKKASPMTAARKFWNMSKKFTQFRENWLRHAAYLDYVERFEKGESMESIGYGAASPAMVDGTPDIKDKAALLAKSLVGDYAAISHYGRDLRDKVIPFYSWLEVNTGRYNRLIANAYKEGVGKGLATTGISGALAGSRITAYLLMRTAVVYALINAWNHMAHGEEEEKLSAQQRDQLHAIIGSDKEGNIYTLRVQGALSDYLSWIGLEDVVAELKEVNKGRSNMTEVFTAAAKAPVNRILSGLTPLIKSPIEIAMGKSLYPDVFKPRMVNDRAKQFAQIFSTENEYDWLAGKPTKGYADSWMNSIAYRKNPGEISYYAIKDRISKWNSLQGKERDGFFKSPKSDALRNYKLAKRYGDKEAEKKYWNELLKIGITNKSLRQSIERSAPLALLSKADRAKFLQTLTPRERKILSAAKEWYYNTYYK